jgi:hypothetical protein
VSIGSVPVQRKWDTKADFPMETFHPFEQIINLKSQVQLETIRQLFWRLADIAGKRETQEIHFELPY